MGAIWAVLVAVLRIVIEWIKGRPTEVAPIQDPSGFPNWRTRRRASDWPVFARSMRALGRLLLGMTLTSCSALSATPTTQTSTEVPCQIIDPGPTPALQPVQGCLTVDEEIALSLYIARVTETRDALRGCSRVQLVESP